MLHIKDFGDVGQGQNANTAYADMLAVARTEYRDMELGPGEFVFTSTIDMGGAGQLRLYGEGPDNTCVTFNGNGPAFTLGGHTGTRKSGIEGVYMRRGDGTMPSPISGNYGVSVPSAGAGTGIFIRDCAIVGFGDHAIRIAGPTGPTVIEDVEIYRGASYGIVLANASGLAPQDVSIVRGSIQHMRGGIVLDAGCTSTSVYDTDIELGEEALYPALNIGIGGGHAFHNVTCSVGAVVAPAAVVYCEGFGNTFHGGLNFSNANSPVDNYWFMGANACKNTVIGGHHHNPSGGYFARVQSGVQNGFINPNLGTYSSGKAVVFDMSSPANRSFTVGVPTAAGVEQVPTSASAADIVVALRALNIFTA